MRKEMNRQVAGLFMFLVLEISGCKPPAKTEDQSVIVRCSRDINAPFVPWLTKVSIEFSSPQPRTRSGKPILITTFESSDFNKTLSGDVGTRLHPDLIIVSSASQIPQNLAISEELKDAKDICPRQSPCVAFIPSWVQGDQRDATDLYINFLLAHK
jgi:hypothetical protein